MWKIFEGANGYYIAWESADYGFHHQPADNGSHIGWDLDAAKRELKRMREEEASNA